jgi:hypothetical protein
MDQRSQQNRRAFFSDQNETMLYGMLSSNFQQRLGAQLSETQSSRLERALEHYMSEVFESNASLPVQALNKEVIAVTASDFTDYLQRKESVATATPQMFQDASQRYDQLQQDRQRTLEAPRPAIPDYVQPMVIKEDDSVSALSLFEEAKKRRNMEVNSQAEEQLVRRNASSNQPIYSEAPPSRPDPRALYDMPLDLVTAGSQNRELPGRADMNMTLARPGPTIAPRGSLQQDMIIKQEDIQSYKESEFNLSIYSADRNWESNHVTTENRFNFSVNLFAGNSATGVSLMPKGMNRLRNIVRIEFVKAVIPIEATDMVVRKIDSTTSPDFKQAFANAQAITVMTTNAAGSTNPVAVANLAQAGLQKLKNLNELLGNSKAYSNTELATYDTTFSKNVYSYPFITLNVTELDTNTYGTSDSMDNAFGILQYDSNWTDNTNSLGFTSLIPKHMKCQRIYAPTPLATLNKLTIRLQQPNGNLINSSQDTLDISGIFLSRYSSIQPYFQNTMDLSGTVYSDAIGEYIWLDCKKWFSRYQLAIGDRIQIKNLRSVAPTAAVTELMSFLQDTDGLIVAGTAYSRPITQAEKDEDALVTSGDNNYTLTAGLPGTLASSVLVDGCNDAGYSRFIILRGKFQDPTTGSVSYSPYGGAADNSAVSTAIQTGSTKIIPGKLINLSRQTQLIFRVITREYDSTSLVRPDNL